MSQDWSSPRLVKRMIHFRSPVEGCLVFLQIICQWSSDISESLNKVPIVPNKLQKYQRELEQSLGCPITALIFSKTVERPTALMTCDRYRTFSRQDIPFDGFTQIPRLNNRTKIWIISVKWSSKVLDKTMISSRYTIQFFHFNP
jgi:hypothetical protein